MDADVVTALWIALIVLLTLWVWRTAAGLAADSENATLAAVGSGMFGVTG